MAEVNLRKVVKRYDDVEAVRGIDLDIADHEFVVLVGPSGCGKSTLLRLIAGLDSATRGDIRIGARRVNDLEPAARRGHGVPELCALPAPDRGREHRLLAGKQENPEA